MPPQKFPKIRVAFCLKAAFLYLNLITGIVPSTPTLFVPRRSDGFGEAVSSPHVPTSGRFTFNESGSQSNVGTNEVVPEQTLEISNIEDNSK